MPRSEPERNANVENLNLTVPRVGLGGAISVDVLPCLQLAAQPVVLSARQSRAVMSASMRSQLMARCVARVLPRFAAIGKRPRNIGRCFPPLLVLGRSFGGEATPAASSWLPDSMKQQLEQMKG